MPKRSAAVLVWWTRRTSAALLVAWALAQPAAGQSTQSVVTQPGSGVAIQVTNIYNGMPLRGFLPVRVNITNSSNSDGQWEVETRALSGIGTDSHIGAKASCAVPAQGTRMIEVLAPLPDSDENNQPRVTVHITGPGVVNSDVSFSSNVQQVPPNALRVTVPMTTTTGARGVTTFGPTRSSTSFTTDPATGTSTRTVTTIRPDGSTTTEVLLTRPDGSTQATTTEIDPSGRIIARSSYGTPANRGTTATAPPPAAAYTITSSGVSSASVSRNLDGSTTLTTSSSRPDGTTLTVKKTTKPDGTNSSTYTITNSAGTVIEGGSGEGPASPASRPSGAPGGAFAPVDHLERVAATINGLQLSTTAQGDQTKTTSGTDPLTGATVSITSTKHADGSTTTVTATPTKVGTDMVTVTTDAKGAIKSTTHELSLSPQIMEQAVPGTSGVSTSPLPNVPGQSVGVARSISYNLGEEKMLLAAVSAAVQPSATATPASAPVVRQPPPPPPPPPPAPPATGPRSSVTLTGGGTLIIGGPATSTAARGGRVGAYRTYNRTPGASIFIGLSSTLAHDQGEKIKAYYLNTCVRPLQQSTLDPTMMSADWRAYLGFDLVFFTAADWLAAPPEIRLALTQWVAAGGELRIISNQDGGLNLPPRVNEHYGAGAIEVFSEDELNNYNFGTEHTDPKERALFSLEYHPLASADASPQSPGYDVPAGMQVREFEMTPDTLMRLTGMDPFSNPPYPTVAAPAGYNPIIAAEGVLVNFLANSGVYFNGGASAHLNAASRHLVVINNLAALDQVSQALSRYGISAVDSANKGTSSQKPTTLTANPAAPAKTDEAKTETDLPKFVDQMPHLGNRYFVVACVIICFGLLVGPINLFLFCNGPRRPHLLWVTPLLAIVASVAILGFILLAEGIGGRGIYYRITQLNPDGKFAVESEIESSVTGVLMHHDFDLGELAWVLDYAQGEPGMPAWPHGSFIETGKHYSGDWFASRREQMLFARAVVPSRASLRAEVAEGKPPVLHSEYNGLMVNLFYEDSDGRYWKIDRMTDGQPTHLQPATAEEFTNAWDENLRSAPRQLTAYLRKVTPVPGTFFALGSGEASPLEPEFAGLRWNRFRHLITGPVLQ